MIPIKTDQEIGIMREGGRKLARILDQVLKAIKPGVSLRILDQLAESGIEKTGGKPSFKKVKNYSWTTCININEGVVHGIPNEYQIKSGDLVSLDIGMFYRGFHTDMARTVRITNCELRITDDKFLEVGKKALKEAIEAAKPGNRVGHISLAIEKEIKKAGFRPIESLTGHGVGRNLHEEPLIPCFLKGSLERTALLKKGMTLAIEVIYAQNKPDLVLSLDGWTISTQDGKPAGLFEDTIVITNNQSLVLTDLTRC